MMKAIRILPLLLCLASAALASLARSNEQGVSGTHSYTRLGPNEVVSNLNGNLVLTIPVADITGASPLGIHLERSYNSHWRDPLVVHQFDLVNNGSYGWRESPDWDWRDDSWTSRDFSIASLFQESIYDNPGKAASRGNAATAMAMGMAVTGTAWSVTEVVHDLSNLASDPTGKENLVPETAAAWGSVAFSAASLILKINSMANHDGPMNVEETISTFATMGYSLANLSAGLYRVAGETVTTTARNTLLVVGAALQVYSTIRYEQEANPWDPGYQTGQVLVPLSMMIDLVGTAVVLTTAGPAGWVILAVASVVELAQFFITLHELEAMRWDMGEVRVEPWALSVNGYVGMLGTKNPQDYGVAAYPFSKSFQGTVRVGQRTTVETYHKSVHPMPDMFLVRSGGAAERFILEPWDGASRWEDGDSVRWYPYQKIGDGRTRVYYRDAKPYQNEGGVVDDPNDFYVVKEPDGTWARFGADRGTKGIDTKTTDFDGDFDTYWALPNSVHHYGGDSITIRRDAGLRVSEVHHSSDPRWVRLSAAGSTETVEVMPGTTGASLSHSSIEWQEFHPIHRRHDPEGVRDPIVGCTSTSSGRGGSSTCQGPLVYKPLQLNVRMPVAVTVPVSASKNLVTRLDWDDGDLSSISYPDGAKAVYSWHRDGNASVLDGFLRRRTQMAKSDGAGAQETVELIYSGWIPDQAKSSFLTTDVVRTVKTPGPNGSVASSASTSSRYSFTNRQVEARVRNKPSSPLPEGADTTLASYSTVLTSRLQLQTAWEGIEGDGTRTDYVWEGDRLRMKLVRPGSDTAFVPLVTVYHYDSRGSLVVSQANPAQIMSDLEWTSMLALSGKAEEVSAGNRTLTRDSLLAEISVKTGGRWKARFDTLDRTEIYGWHHEEAGELVQDTAYLGYNPFRRRDSLAWLDVKAILDSVIDGFRNDSLDSTCAAAWKSLNTTGCKLKRPPFTMPDSVLSTSQDHSGLSEIASAYVLQNAHTKLQSWRLTDSLARVRADADSVAWHKYPDTVLLHWKHRSHAFDPYGRFISVPEGQWVTRKHPDAAHDSLALGNGLIGSITVYDSLLRVVRVDNYRHDTIPGVRYEYGDSRFPFVPTGVRTYVGRSGNDLQYRYTRNVLDGFGRPVETQAWKRIFSEASTAAGLPGNIATDVTASGAADFWSVTTRDEKGRATKVVDARGGVSEAEYDDLDRVVRAKTPGGNWTRTDYSDIQDRSGIVWTKSIRESGVQDLTGVNGLGWSVVSGVVSADGHDSLLSHQAFGVHGLQWSQDGEGRLITYSYDSRGRMVWSTISHSDGSLQTWYTSYNDFERSLTNVDPTNHQSKSWFDIEGRVIKVERKVGAQSVASETRYDNLGNVVWTRSPSGDTARYTYTLQNLLDSTQTPQGLAVRSHYNWTGDAVGTSRHGTGSGLLSGISGGDSSSLAYDGLGRLVGVTVSGDARMSQTLHYDTLADEGSSSQRIDPGMLLGLTRGTGATGRMGYDARGSMTARHMASGLASANLLDTLSWEYLADGRPKAQVLPRGARIEYGWDQLDRLGKVTFVDPKGTSHVVVDTLLYRKGGALDSLALGNGSGQRFGYDTSTGLPTTHRVVSRGRVLGERKDRYDGAVRLVERTRLDGQTVYYTYDSLERLSGVRYGLGKSDEKPNYHYGWNAEGARTETVHDFGTNTWTVGEVATGSTNQAISSVGSHDGASVYGWDWQDALGSRRWQTSLTDPTRLDSVRYGWNGAGELERFTRLESGADRTDTTRLGQSFGDHGLRTAKYRGTLTGSGPTDTTWSLERRSVWDGPDVVADSTAGDRGWRYRIVLGLNAVAEAERDSLGVWKLTYIVSDPVGSPEVLMDDTGALVGRAAWGPFGELEDWQGNRMPDFLFGGREWDGDIQAQVFGYRLYDPVQGQFLQTDPLEQFWNPYSYVGGNPLGGVDPWGMESDGWNGSSTQGGMSGPETYYTGDEGSKAQIVPAEAVGVSSVTRVVGHRTQTTASSTYNRGADATSVSLQGMISPAIRTDLSSQEIDVLRTRDAVRRGDEAAMMKIGAAVPGGNDDGMILAGMGAVVSWAGEGLVGFSRVYSTAFEVRLPESILGRSRSVHFNRANAMLDEALAENPVWAAQMEELIPGVQNSVSSVGGRATPSGWVWHHELEPGVLRLVPEAQHVPGSAFWKTLHPQGFGGYSVWGIPNGAPPN